MAGDRYRHQVTGRMNNARGKLLEQLIENSCRLYEEEGRALIEKTPEPMRVVRKLNDGAHFICVFEKKGQPDFKGTIAGGRAVVFESKYTEAGRISQSAVTDEQAKRFEQHHALGAYCSIARHALSRNSIRLPVYGTLPMISASLHLMYFLP